MTMTTVEYEITDEDLPILKNIREIEDGRENYFCEDYKRENKYKHQSARDCHTTYSPPEFWIEMFQAAHPKIIVQHFQKYTFGDYSVITITSEKILTDAEKKAILTTFTVHYEYLSEIKTLEFDLRLNPSYKKAVEMDGIDVFEDWLYGNVFTQTADRCDKDSTHMKVSDGVYKMTFTKDVDEYEARKYVDWFIEEEMVSWLEQDVPKKKEKEL